MKLTQTAALGIPVHWLDETPSTNVTLEQMWGADPALPHETLIVTDRQTAGRGRQGRGWEMPAGRAIAASLLVRDVTGISPSWLPLITGSAVVRATQPWFPDARIGVKWPNDVHVVGQSKLGVKLGAKLNGILCQLLGDGSAIVGVGTNLLLTEDELPTERAGSWLTEGAGVGAFDTVHSEAGVALVDEYLAAWMTEMRALLELAASAPEQLQRVIATDSATLGTQVRVMLPGGGVLTGIAVRLASDGALVVRRDDGVEEAVHAGDVEHLRERQ